ncbi:MAG: hypothetical protein ABSC34_04060 [Acidimicrobiales bacterium]
MNAARVASLKVLPLSIAVLSLSSLGALGSPAGATSSATGVISGHVDECGPGPIPVTPTNHPPAPQPVVVTVRHGERTVAYEQVVMTTSLPWTGTFSFNVPAGRYEVISSYREVARWVHVRPGARTLVSFGLFACPMTTGGSPKL